MTTQEFKQWFEGFEEARNSDLPPSAAQWDRIKEKIKTLTPTVPHVSSHTYRMVNPFESASVVTPR